ncbi:ribonuclease H, partial [Trifolium pratense]
MAFGGEDGPIIKALIRWMPWDKLSYPKKMGGLGFRDFHAFNKAMIAKQGWRIMDNPDLLVSSKVLKAREVLKTSCRWVVGDRRKVRVMGEPWLRGEEGKWLSSPQVEEAFQLHVNQLMVEGERKWDEQKIQTLFPSEVAHNI